MELLHEPGEIIAQRYRIVETLGEGGSGTTYQAEDIQSSQQVALKALSLHRMTDWKMMELFEREARILSQLNHPAIPRYLDYFQVDTAQDRKFYIAQQLVPGKSLAVLVENGWHPDMSEVWHITIHILDILVYLHSLTPPVIHRDIKPQNIIRQENGRVFLVDFGAVQDTYHNTVTGGSTVVGTYGYMAPEQFRGQAVLSTDLYGLGTTLLFLLTGQSPAKLPQRKLKIDFRSHVRVFQEFADWLEKMLEPAIEDRFSSAKEALTVLWGEQVHTSSLAQKPHSPKNSHLIFIGIASVLALCFFRAIAYYVFGLLGILLALVPVVHLGILLARVLGVQFNKAYPYYSRAVDRHRQGDNQTAIEDYNQAIRLNPKYAKAYINRGAARLALRDNQGAIEDYNQAIRLKPNNAAAYFKRAAIRSGIGDRQGAIEDFTQAIRLNPCANYYYNRGVTHYQLGNNQEAIEDMTQALRLNPFLASAYYNRGNARHNLGDKLGAFEDYNQARLIEPRNAIAPNDEQGYYGRGLARSLQGDNQGAIEDLQKAATLCSEHRNTALYQQVQEAIRNLQI